MIWELLEMFVAFMLFLAAHGLGVARERNRKTPPPPKPPPHTVCGCNCQLSFHEGLGVCKGEQQVYVKRDKQGASVYEQRPCTCQQYTGELPDDWFARDSMRELAAPAVSLEKKEDS